MNNGVIGVFDSGVGGLKILWELRRVLPSERYVYVFDRSGAPYGSKSAKQIIKRVEKVSRTLMALGAKTIVVGCNTATGVAIGELRKKFGVPFVGTEPPLRLAARETDGKILLLCTPRTAAASNVERLIAEVGKNRVIVAPQKTLASDIEREFGELSALRGTLERVLAPFSNAEIGAVALGCTHYYYVKGMIEEYFGKKVKVFDSASGVAAETVRVIDEFNLAGGNSGRVRYVYM